MLNPIVKLVIVLVMLGVNCSCWGQNYPTWEGKACFSREDLSELKRVYFESKDVSARIDSTLYTSIGKSLFYFKRSFIVIHRFRGDSCNGVFGFAGHDTRDLNSRNYHSYPYLPFLFLDGEVIIAKDLEEGALSAKLKQYFESNGGFSSDSLEHQGEVDRLAQVLKKGYVVWTYFDIDLE